LPFAGDSPWPQALNQALHSHTRGMRKARGAGRATPLAVREPAPPPFGAERAVRFSPAAAEAMVRQGLEATLLAELAELSGLDARHLYEFAGIDRTTVTRRAAKDGLLPQEAAVKAMQFAELSAQAVDVFGEPAAAMPWLTQPHPLLDGETPLQRARTPWGLMRVQSLLGALQYGGAA
jgi:putative toxin-antitoxin system antitoxin component (TIGR02293 family)